MRVPGWILEQDNLARRAGVTVTNETDATNYPARNIIALPVSKPARLNNRATNRLYFTFNGPTSIDFCALVAHNLSSTATITLRGGSAFDGADFTQTMTWRRRTAFVHLSAAESYRYWSVDITDEANEYGFLEVGYAMLGVLTIADFGFLDDWPISDRMIQLVAETETGTPDVRHLGERQAVQLSFSDLTAAEFETVRQVFLEQLGAKEPLFFVPDTLENEGFFGRFEQDELERANRNLLRKGTKLQIVEDPSGIILQGALPSLKAGEALSSAWTFTRTGTALYKNSELALVEAAEDEVRNSHFLDYGIEGILIEAVQRTNAWTYSEDLSQGVYTAGHSSIVSNAIDEPSASPTGSADKLVEDSDTNQYHTLTRNLATCSDNTTQSVSFFAKASERSKVLISGFGKASAGSVGYFYLDLSTGLTSGAVNWAYGTNFSVERYSLGWWRVAIRWDVLAGASTPKITIYMIQSGTATQYNGDGTSGIYLWGFQHEVDKAFPSSFIPTVASPATRNAENLSAAWGFAGQALTVLYDGVEIGGRYIVLGRLLQFGQDGGDVDPRLLLYSSGTTIYLLNDAGASTVTASRSPVAIGHSMELRGALYPDGSVLLELSENGGAESPSGQSAALSLSDYDSLQIGADNTPAQGSLLFIRNLKIARGVRTLSEMRKL